MGHLDEWNRGSETRINFVNLWMRKIYWKATQIRTNIVVSRNTAFVRYLEKVTKWCEWTDEWQRRSDHSMNSSFSWGARSVLEHPRSKSKLKKGRHTQDILRINRLLCNSAFSDRDSIISQFVQSLEPSTDQRNKWTWYHQNIGLLPLMKQIFSKKAKWKWINHEMGAFHRYWLCPTIWSK